MKTSDRRQLVKANVIDASIARVAINASRRERAIAAERLRKDLAAKNFAARSIETVSYQEAG